MQRLSVGLLTSSETNHMVSLIERPNLISSAGLNLSSKSSKYINQKFSDYKISPSMVDLYSCFPVAVQQFENALELSPSIPKTFTGGMPLCGRTSKQLHVARHC